jgi:Holliday junction resolvase RusA-like endonuclease
MTVKETIALKRVDDLLTKARLKREDKSVAEAQGIVRAVLADKERDG